MTAWDDGEDVAAAKGLRFTRGLMGLGFLLGFIPKHTAET